MTEKEIKKLYSLGCGERMQLHRGREYYITRVPGGWLWLDRSNNSTVFVPWDREFMRGEQR